MTNGWTGGQYSVYRFLLGAVLAVGVAWHAGVGMYPWLPTNMGNWHMIGIECANSGTSPTAPHRRNWPDAQYDALVARKDPYLDIARNGYHYRSGFYIAADGAQQPAACYRLVTDGAPNLCLHL
jgi:hypothetical protein